MESCVYGRTLNSPSASFNAQESTTL